jgi:GWxTD domain-containing protein
MNLRISPLPISVVLLCAGLLLRPCGVSGQQPDPSAFRDSLTRVTDTLALRQLDDARAAAGNSAEGLLQRGLIHLRLSELTHRDKHAGHAQALFAEAERAGAPKSWTAYGKGLSLTAAHDVRIPSPAGILNGVVVAQSFAEILGLDPASRARRAFRKALESDSLFTPAAIELGELAARSHKGDALQDALTPLKQALARDSSNASAALALADVALSAGELSVAEHAAARLLASGGDSALALRVLANAVARQKGRDEEAAAAYFRGISRADTTALNLYFIDVEPIATDSEKAAWSHASSIAQRRAQLEQFWEMRSALSGLTPAERVAEHYRRMGVASERYWRRSFRGAPSANALYWQPARKKSSFDDRGLVYLRYGEPSARLATHSYSTPAGAQIPNESWVYSAPDGKMRLFNFIRPDGMAGGSGADWVLLGELPCDPAFLDDRRAIALEYGRLAARCDTLTQLQLSAEMREKTLGYMRHDEARPRFASSLPIYHDVYTFRGNDGKTLVTTALAISGNGLTAAHDAAGVRYSMKLSLVLADTVARHVERMDTFFTLVHGSALTGEQSLRTAVDKEMAPSSTVTLRLTAADRNAPERGSFMGGPVRVPDYSGQKLMISDVVLAAPDGGTWRRGGVRLSLIPTREFPAGVPFSFYYEIYNLSENSAYTTQIELEPASGGLGGLKKLFGGKRSLRFSFDGMAGASSVIGVQELRKLQAQLPEGRYRIRVTVTVTRGGTREQAASERLFQVVDVPRH